MVAPKPDIPPFGKIEPSKSLEQETQTKPDTKAFESLMQKETEPTKSQVSPMQLAQLQQSGVASTPESLLGQVNSTAIQMDDIRNRLNTPDLTLKNSHQKLLNSKLTEANEHLQKASEYLGAEEINPTQLPDDVTPVAKFLGYLTDGQNRLLAAKQQLSSISAKGGELHPSEMMLIQINLSQAQQEIEFSSVLLSKVTDALKQTLSIQL
jgi:hypothetical protein